MYSNSILPQYLQKRTQQQRGKPKGCVEVLVSAMHFHSAILSHLMLILFLWLIPMSEESNIKNLHLSCKCWACFQSPASWLSSTPLCGSPRYLFHTSFRPALTRLCICNCYVNGVSRAYEQNRHYDGVMQQLSHSARVHGSIWSCEESYRLSPGSPLSSYLKEKKIYEGRWIDNSKLCRIPKPQTGRVLKCLYFKWIWHSFKLISCYFLLISHYFKICDTWT